MIEIVAAIKQRMAGLPWTLYDSDATGATKYPYVLLLPPAGGLDPEHTLGGPRTAILDEFMVRAVGAAADSVRGVLGRTRDVLGDLGRPVTFDTAKWRVTLTRQPGPVPVQVDRDSPITGTNTYPLFATDFYDLAAEPL